MKNEVTNCDNVCLLVRNLISDGQLRHLMLVKKLDDGKFSYSPFECETEHTLFIDDTIVVLGESAENVDFAYLNTLNYDQLIKYFIIKTTEKNNTDSEILLALNPSDVKLFNDFSR